MSSRAPKPWQPAESESTESESSESESTDSDSSDLEQNVTTMSIRGNKIGPLLSKYGTVLCAEHIHNDSPDDVTGEWIFRYFDSTGKEKGRAKSFEEALVGQKKTSGEIYRAGWVHKEADGFGQGQYATQSVCQVAKSSV